MTIVLSLPDPAAARAVAADMMQYTRRQAPARKVLRDALKARATHLRSLGVDREAIEQDALRFIQYVHALLPRKRVAGAAAQVEGRLVARIGERRAAAVPATAMPRLPPIAPHLRVRFPNKVALHPTWWMHRSRDVGSYAAFIIRERYAEVAEFHLQRSGNVVRYFLERLFLDGETIDRHARGFEARVRAEVWRRVLLDHDPTRKNDDELDRG